MNSWSAKFIAMFAGLFGLGSHPPPMSSFDYCYDDFPMKHAATLPEIATDSTGLPQGWHAQFLLAVNSKQPSPESLPDEIKLLPDISGFRDVDNLRVAMLNDGGGKLYLAVRSFAERDPLDLLAGGEVTHNQVRDIIFRWLGVQSADPQGRGHFIDGRELAFVERMTGTPFVQMWHFTNPLPIAATAVKDVFAKASDHYAGLLLYQVSKKAFFDEGGKLTDAGKSALASRASLLSNDEERKHFWRNVVAMTREAGPWTENAMTLEPAIRNSMPQLSVSVLVEDLDHGLAGDYDWEDHYARNANTIQWRHFNGKRIWFHGYYKPDFSQRRVCYSFIDK